MKKNLHSVLIATVIIVAFLIGRYIFPVQSKNRRESFGSKPPSEGIIPTETEEIKLVDPQGHELDWSLPSPKQITISDLLEKRGITRERISHFKYIGDESSETGTIELLEADQGEIEWIWTWIFMTAEPYSFWVPSGNRVLEIYVQEQQHPAARLLVNETDATSLNGVSGRFMCRGLNTLIDKKLTAQHKYNKQILLLHYSDFGPQAAAYTLLGFEWWQWNPHGDSDPTTTYDIHVVVYNEMLLKDVQDLYPIKPAMKRDYRYVEYTKALEYLDKLINEDREGIISSGLRQTKQRILSHFQE